MLFSRKCKAGAELPITWSIETTNKNFRQKFLQSISWRLRLGPCLDQQGGETWFISVANLKGAKSRAVAGKWTMLWRVEDSRQESRERRVDIISDYTTERICCWESEERVLNKLPSQQQINIHWMMHSKLMRELRVHISLWLANGNDESIDKVLITICVTEPQ